MKRFAYFVLASILIPFTVFAIEPVILSAPVPAVAPLYASSTDSTITYTLTNNVPKTLPVSITGISNGIARTTVANDCGNAMPAGPSTCNIGITISPQAAPFGSAINQTLEVNYQGRAPLTSPIAFSVIQPFAYVTPSPSASSILQFLLDPTTGLFSSSSTAFSSLTQTYDELTFAIVGGVQYAYPIDQNGFVYQCPINADGTFNSCNPTPPSPPAWMPRSIAFATVMGVQYAYIPEVNVGYVYQCSLNGDGSFNVCNPAISAPFNAPYGVTFATVSGTQYAYIAEALSVSSASGSVYRCTLNSDGSFNVCTTTPISPPAWIAYSVTFTTVGGAQFAYVADNGTTPNGNVYQCTLDSNGFFNTCTPTPTSPPVSNWVPSDIAFVTLNGTQYAYVANYQGSTEGGMYVCGLNLDGSFSTCNPTPLSPPSPFQPVGIAFRF